MTPALVLAGALAAAAMPPPTEATLFAGYDEQGRGWWVHSNAEGPVVVGGPQRHELAGFEDLASSAAVGGGAVWFTLGRDRVFRVSVADGRMTPFVVPARDTADLLAVGDLLYARGTVGSSGATTLLRLDPRSGRTEVLFTATVPRSILAFTVGPRTAWVVTWGGLDGSRQELELVGLPRDGGRPTVRETRALEWARGRWTGVALREDAAGGVWMANSYAGRVERRDAAGAWRTWDVRPWSVVAGLALSQATAVALVERLAPVAGPGPPGRGRASDEVAERALVVLDPAASDGVRSALPLDVAVERLADAGGRLWLAAGTEVRLVAGRAVVSPSAPPR